MILITTVRLAICECCGSYRFLDFGAPPPVVCYVCGTAQWLYGKGDHSQQMRRIGATKAEVVLDPFHPRGRRYNWWAEKQYRQFRDKDGKPLKKGNP
jgi:hypothetical protein